MPLAAVTAGRRTGSRDRSRTPADIPCGAAARRAAATRARTPPVPARRADQALRAGARVDYVRRMSLSPQDLRRVPLLSDLREKELSRLANILKERRLEARRPIIVEGGGGIAFFMMLDGRATVRVGDEVRAELGPGDFFGEQALLDDGAPRSAAVVAETEVRCLGMSAWEFPSFVRDHPPIAWKLLQTLAGRLREGREREGRLRAAGTTTAPA